MLCLTLSKVYTQLLYIMYTEEIKKEQKKTIYLTLRLILTDWIETFFCHLQN